MPALPPEVPGQVPSIEVVVTEELTGWTAAHLHGRLARALRLRPARLIVDLAGCPHLDAAGIGMLLRVHREAVGSGCQLVLRSPSARLRRNLGLARVDRVLHIAPPEASTPEASTPGAGTPEASTPGAGTPGAGTPEAGTGGVRRPPV